MADSQKGTKVLLVAAEDDEDHFVLIKEAFEKLTLAMEIRRVGDGEELMDYLLHRGGYRDLNHSPVPDMILLDLNMPKKDGREALKEIKSYSQLRSIPVVVLSTSKAPDDVLLSYDLGASSFLKKPLGFHQWIHLAKTFWQYWFETVELPPRSSNGTPTH